MTRCLRTVGLITLVGQVLVVLALGNTLSLASGVHASAAKPTVAFEVTFEGELRQGHAQHLILQLRNATNVGGFEVLLRHDPQRLEISGLYRLGFGLRGDGRTVLPLDAQRLQTGFLLGAATCPETICGTSRPSAGEATPGIDGTTELAVLDVTPLVAGELALDVEGLRVVDRQGKPLSVHLTTPPVMDVIADRAAAAYSTIPRGLPLTRTALPVPGQPATPDLTGNGRVDAGDVAEARFAWSEAREQGALCGVGVMARFDVVADGCFDIADIQSIVAQATAGSDPAGQALQAVEPQALSVVDALGDENDVAVGNGVCRTERGVCTLRAAIQEANARSGADRITFNIPGTGVKTIQLTQGLPVLTDMAGVTIDGYTQPGARPNTAPNVSNATILIELRGQGADITKGGFNGIRFTSSNNVFRGLALYNFHRPITSSGTDVDDNLIAGCWVGVSTAGVGYSPQPAPGANEAVGIRLRDAGTNNRIGTPALADRNVVSGNARDGIEVFGADMQNNRVQNNIVGLSPDGRRRTPNWGDGIDVNTGSHGNLIGGTGLHEGNVISGNQGDGIEVSHFVTTRQNVIAGNFIGADPTGRASNLSLTLNSGFGITLEDRVSNNVIRNNVIIGNPKGGIQIYGGTAAEPASGNRILNNRIGIDVDNKPAGNGNRLTNPIFGNGIILRFHTTRTTVGPGNIIAYSGKSAVLVSGVDSDRNTITRNIYIRNGGPPITLVPADADGANQGLNPPIFTRVSQQTVQGRACGGCRVELYHTKNAASATASVWTYVATVTADTAGSFTFTPGTSVAGQPVAAMATDQAGNSSPFGSPTGVVFLPFVRH